MFVKQHVASPIFSQTDFSYSLSQGAPIPCLSFVDQHVVAFNRINWAVL